VVAFQQQGVAAGQVRQHVRRGMPQIGEHAQFELAVGTSELQRFTSVMRHGEGRDLKFTQVDGLPVGREFQQAVKVGAAYGLVSAPAHPDRHAVLQGELTRATDVVAVLVGDEDGVQRLFVQLGLGQA